jgi:hypothetical protein
MKLKTLFIFAVAVTLTGCSNTLTGPVATTQPFNFPDYFWPDVDTLFQYVRDVDGHTHILSITKNGPVKDHDLNTDSIYTLTVARTADGINSSGFSSYDCFAFDPVLEIVTDSTPDPKFTPIRIKSIASVFSTGTWTYRMYAIDDTALYQYASEADELSWICSLPTGMSPSVRLFEDQNKSKLYLVEIGGRNIYSITPTSKSPSWSSPKMAPNPIAVFAAADSRDQFPYYIASGGQIYQYDSKSNQFNNNIPPFATTIAALEKEQGGPTGNSLLIGLTDGKVFAMDPSNIPQPIINLQSPISSIAGGMIATTNGLYSTGNGFQPAVYSGSVSALYTIGYGQGTTVYAALSNDSVVAYNNLHFTGLGIPFNGVATQFAWDYKNRPYALVGNRVFGLRDYGWETKAQSTSKTAQWSPGGFKMLSKDDQWLAGYVVNFASNNRRGYAYKAKLEIPSSDIKLDGILYENVIAVRYTPNALGVAETVHAPEYLIYYQKGTGPIRIEKSEAGTKQITRIVLP